jgi:hypothetical protein
MARRRVPAHRAFALIQRPAHPTGSQRGRAFPRYDVAARFGGQSRGLAARNSRAQPLKVPLCGPAEERRSAASKWLNRAISELMSNRSFGDVSQVTLLTSRRGEGFPEASENGLKTKTLATRLPLYAHPVRG